MTVELAVKGLWALARYLPAFLLRLYFTKERLANLVYVDVRPRHDPVTLQLGPPADVNVYVQVINLSPVPIELDRAEFRVICHGVTVKTVLVKKETFATGAIGLIYFRENLHDSQAENIARNLGESDVSLDGHIEFNCAIRSFPKAVPSLSGIRPRVLNRQLWVSQ